MLKHCEIALFVSKWHQMITHIMLRRIFQYNHKCLNNAFNDFSFLFYSILCIVCVQNYCKFVWISIDVCVWICVPLTCLSNCKSDVSPYDRRMLWSLTLMTSVYCPQPLCVCFCLAAIKQPPNLVSIREFAIVLLTLSTQRLIHVLMSYWIEWNGG